MNASEVNGHVDLEDPVPVIRLLNRQLAGEAIDPEEAFEVIEEIESVVIGDVESCRSKIEGYRSIGIDRLMCSMSFGHVSQEDTLKSIRLTGEQLIPDFALQEPSVRSANGPGSHPMTALAH